MCNIIVMWIKCDEMSVLFSESNCTLISHKEYINRIYGTRVDSRDNSGSDVKRTFAFRDGVFDFNLNNQNDNDNKRRHRKINAKKNNISISSHPELHELVSGMSDGDSICQTQFDYKSPIFRIKRLSQNQKNFWTTAGENIFSQNPRRLRIKMTTIPIH